MKSLPFYVSTGASALCLLLGIWLFVLSFSNQGLQSNLQQLQQEVQNQQQILQVKQQQVQAQQEQINAGNTISQQVGPALLREMGQVSLKNEKMKKVLAKHGYNVELKPEEGKEAPKAAPVAPAPAVPAATPKPTIP